MLLSIPGPDWTRDRRSLNCSCHLRSHLQEILQVRKLFVGAAYCDQLVMKRSKTRLNLAVESMEAKETREVLKVKDESACCMLPEKKLNEIKT